MVSKFYVDKAVAFGPMPSDNDVELLSREFTAVVVLTYPEEMNYNILKWRTYGVKVLHSPVEDFRAPPLLNLVWIVEWILNEVKEGGKVLIHCKGGYGRSATVAASYLIRRYGLEANDAIAIIKRLRSHALEVEEMEAVIKAYATLLKVVDVGLLVNIAERFKELNLSVHKSKVLQIALNLLNSLVVNGDVSSLCLYELVRRFFKEYTVFKTVSTEEVTELCDAIVDDVLKIAEYLDYNNSQSVYDASLVKEGVNVKLKVICSPRKTLSCGDVVSKALANIKKIRLLKEEKNLIFELYLGTH